MKHIFVSKAHRAEFVYEVKMRCLLSEFKKAIVKFTIKSVLCFKCRVDL